MAPGSLVHRSAIIDVLWHAGPPATAVSAVQSHISRLRGLLAGRPRGSGPVDEQRPPGDGGGPLVSAGACYSLRAGRGELDLLVFGQLAEDARRARDAG